MASAEVQLASPFTSHMVLQREMPIPVWGTAAPGEVVTLAFGGQEEKVTADAAGHWRVELVARQASAEGRTMTVRGSATPAPLVLDDILIGEVWLASGQSNMDFSVSKKVKYFAGVLNEEQEIATANHPLIRMFVGEAQKSATPQARVGGQWLVCSPETVPGFSAVGYFFARSLQRDLQVPVGVIVESYGASTAQAWIRREAMLGDPRFKAVLDRFDEIVAKHVPPTAAEIEDWKHAVELAKAEGKRPPRAPGADPVQDQHNPTVMFNGMIAPIVPYAIRGVIWYQGESITAPRELFPAWNELLITDWRKLWGRELPFYFCQLAAQQAASNGPDVRAWQAEALKLPRTGMAVTIDVGEAKNVHPKNKAPVGDRLARFALANTYGWKIESSGPVYQSMTADGGALRLKFTHLGGGLVAQGGALKTFEIAGADGQFVPAEAAIEGDTIVVRSAAVPAPTAARYAWAAWPEGCNLFNAAGLPAAPFMTR